MKRQISVSIFLSILLIVLVWMYIKFMNETKIEENVITTENDISKDPSVTISQEYISYPYYAKAEEGRVVIYETKNHTIFMETSIEITTLSEEIQEKLEASIFFETEMELYDFLESYSS